MAIEGTPSTVLPTRPENGATWERLEDQLSWYDRKSMAAQRAHKRLTVSQLITTALVPLLAALQAPPAATAGLGALVVVLVGLQNLYRFQETWITYRSTAEALKHERYLYLASAGPYVGDDRHRVLAERVEGLVSQEHARWTDSRSRETARGGDDANRSTS
jgi:hypothetical protein